jgi:hypothetical protein
MDFWTNTVKRMTISSAGGVSFGSTGTAYGTTGQVLTSNGNAPPTWGAGLTVASTSEAQAGTNNTNVITPLRLREGFNATGSAPVYACRAWVNFNGTGTVAIRASGNVSSITDNGTGDYTVNFTTAMPDVNFSFIGTCSLESGTARVASVTDDTLNKARTTNSFSVLTKDVNSGVVAAVFDPEYVNIAVFR